jgi:N utilization substance protein B
MDNQRKKSGHGKDSGTEESRHGLPPQKFRELVFQMLYTYTQGPYQEETLIPLFANELRVSKKVAKDAQERVRQLLPHLPEIDALISETSHSYAFERIQTVEKNILRLGMFELFYDSSVPKKVAIAEAKRLAKKFGTNASASFVHALLDAAYQKRLGKNVDPQDLAQSADELEKTEKHAEEMQQEESSGEQPSI